MKLLGDGAIVGSRRGRAIRQPRGLCRTRQRRPSGTPFVGSPETHRWFLTGCAWRPLRTRFASPPPSGRCARRGGPRTDWVALAAQGRTSEPGLKPGARMRTEVRAPGLPQSVFGGHVRVPPPRTRGRCRASDGGGSGNPPPLRGRAARGSDAGSPAGKFSPLRPRFARAPPPGRSAPGEDPRSRRPCSGSTSGFLPLGRASRRDATPGARGSNPGEPAPATATDAPVPAAARTDRKAAPHPRSAGRRARSYRDRGRTPLPQDRACPP